MLEEGTLDATGVQDVYLRGEGRDRGAPGREGREGRAARVILDPGFVIHQGNKAEMAPRMWGAQVARKKAGGA